MQTGLYDESPVQVRADIYKHVFGEYATNAAEYTSLLVKNTHDVIKAFEKRGYIPNYVLDAVYDGSREKHIIHFVNIKRQSLILATVQKRDSSKVQIRDDYWSDEDDDDEYDNRRFQFLAIQTKNQAECDWFKKVIAKFQLIEETKNKLYMMKSEYDSLELDSFPMENVVCDIGLNYGSNFINVHDKVVNNLKEKKSGLYIFHGPPGTGKCMGKGTRVLMFNGSIKKVEDIKNGELVMGPDSSSRIVSGVTSGIEEMFKITPVKGDPYVVNKSHILSLKYSGLGRTGETINISVKNYLTSSKNKKRGLKTWRTGVNFRHKKVPLDPYFLGLWLGDGFSKHPSIISGDGEVELFLKNEFIKKYDDKEIYISSTYNSENSKKYAFYGKRGRRHGGEYPTNSIKDKLIELDVLNNKHIPDLYKINNEDVRLNVLAGLLDSDGYYNSSFSITQKNKRLAEDICFVCRSLGFAAYMKEKEKSCFYKGEKRTGKYFVISISGNLEKIPTKIKRKQATIRKQKKSVLVSGIKVESIGIGEYFGFQVDKDGLFCLGDFTVTHNTSYIKYLTTQVDTRRFILVPNTMVAAIFSPKMVSEIYTFKDSVLILEDAELCVFRRDGTNNELVSGILNITDGLLKDLLNISIFVTFNSSKIEELDEALLRKGRLKLIYKFDALPVTDAQKLLDKLGKSHKADGPMTLAEIYNVDEEIDLTGDIKSNKQVGFSVK